VYEGSFGEPAFSLSLLKGEEFFGLLLNIEDWIE
jgi:hypothetical protein